MSEYSKELGSLYEILREKGYKNDLKKFIGTCDDESKGYMFWTHCLCSAIIYTKKL